MNVPSPIRRISAAVAIGLLAGIVTVVAPPAASAVAPTGIYSVSAQSPYDSQSLKSASVFCLPGDRVLSVGASVSNRAGVRVDFTEIGTVSAGAVGREDVTGTTENWLVEVTAKCVPGSTAIGLGLVVVPGESPNDLTDKAATVTCPAGKWVAGVGGRVQGPGAPRVVIDQIVPLPGQQQSAIVHASAEDASPLGPWKVTAQATCINTQPHVATLQAAGTAQRVFPQCPSSHPYAIGGGAAIGTDADPPNQLWVAGGLGQKYITMYGAGGDFDSYQSAARMNDDANGFPAWARAYLWGYAVCL